MTVPPPLFCELDTEPPMANSPVADPAAPPPPPIDCPIMPVEPYPLVLTAPALSIVTVPPAPPAPPAPPSARISPSPMPPVPPLPPIDCASRP
ncbi:hypothetical protein D3C73_994020 [compost metagenome]